MPACPLLGVDHKRLTFRYQDRDFCLTDVFGELVNPISMVLAGIMVDLLFSALHLITTGPRPASMVAMAHFEWNYTTWLDLVALVVFSVLFYWHKHSPHGMSCHGDHHEPMEPTGHEEHEHTHLAS